MYPRRRFSSVFRPREYSDRQADAMGEGSDADTARGHASGSGPLRRLFTFRHEDEGDEDDHEPTTDSEEESEP